MKFSLIFGLLLFLQSCVIHLVNGNSFEYLMPEQQTKIVKLESFNNLNSNFIYECTGIQLIEELKKHKKSIVYLFKSDCTSEYCLPLNTIEQYAAKNEYKLFLVLSTYSKLEVTTSQGIESQLFSINCQYYGSKKRSKYLPSFKSELGYDLFYSKTKHFGSTMFYEYDSLVNVKRSVLQ